MLTRQGFFQISFMVAPYMETQSEINGSMRAIVVDWLVEIQENFELNHETLYLAIRLVDKYLEKTVIKREQLQLVASTALFIACKFDVSIWEVSLDLTKTNNWIVTFEFFHVSKFSFWREPK
jgi:hypothetical protein